METTIKLNGAALKIFKGLTLDELLKAQGYNTAAIAVELNGQIISRGNYEKTIINDEAVIEVVRFVGGG